MNRSLRNLLPAYLILLFWNISWTISVNGPVMPLYIRSLGMEVIEWSGLVASCAIGMFLFEWVWGMMSDRVDRRAIMAAAMLCMSIVFPLYGLQSLISYFIIFQFFSGALAVTIGPATRAMISEDAPPESMGLSMSLWWAFHTLGRIVGPFVGGYIAQIWSFEYSFYLSSLLSAAGAVCLLMVSRKRKSQRSQVDRQSLIDMVKTPRVLMSVPSVRLLLLEAIPAYMGLSLVRSFLPIYASEEIGMSKIEVGLVVSIGSAAMLLATPLLGWLSDRIGRKVTVCTGFFLSSLVFLCYPLVRTQSQLVMIWIATSVCLSASSMLLAMLSDIAPSRLRGTAMGVYGTFEDLGLIGGSMLFGFVWTAISPASVFVVAFVTQMLGALFLLFIRPGPGVSSQEMGGS